MKSLITKSVFVLALFFLSIPNIPSIGVVGQVNGISAQGGPFLPAKRVTWRYCDNGKRLKRCDFGNGSCEWYQQFECDGDQQ